MHGLIAISGIPVRHFKYTDLMITNNQLYQYEQEVSKYMRNACGHISTKLKYFRTFFEINILVTLSGISIEHKHTIDWNFI